MARSIRLHLGRKTDPSSAKTLHCDIIRFSHRFLHKDAGYSTTRSPDACSDTQGTRWIEG